VIADLDAAQEASLSPNDWSFSFPKEIIEILSSLTPKEDKKDLTA
jgi:hypothetical protein